MRLDLLVNDFVLRAVNDRFIVLFEGDFKRNYLHVRDAAERSFSALENFDRHEGPALQRRPVRGERLQAGPVPADQGAGPGFPHCGIRAGQGPGPGDYIVSNDRGEAAGFKAERTLGQGIAELIKAYRLLPKFVYGNV